ncbi:MAG: hypothetical protein ACXVJ7_06890 [Acidimicrobiia bacterium]
MSDQSTPSPFTHEDVSSYLDREMDDVTRASFANALDERPSLRDELAAIGEVRALVRGLAAVAPPAGWIDSLLAGVEADIRDDDGDGTVVDLAAARTHRRGWARVTATAAAAAAAAAIAAAVIVPSRAPSAPTLATDVRVHQAGAAAAGDPVSGLTPLATPLRFGR